MIIILFAKRPKELKEEKVDDIYISFFSILNFIEIESLPVYSGSASNLGITGRLLLDCYTGICYIEKNYYDDFFEEEVYYYESILDYSCAQQCSYNGKDECDCNVDANLKKGSCSRKYDDEYITGKYCYADNVIYNWKGKQYVALKKEVLTYYNNAILKDEQCPEDTINCGIIDDNENKLCVSSTSNCPINYLSENKLNEKKTYSTVIIGNKTFYYTYDDDISTKRKIIGGLVADTDLLLNNDNDEKIIIDTDTISNFLADNKNLYNEVNLGFDPYKVENIDEKGNSYLRIFYNNKVDLQELRDKINTYNNHKKINEKTINPIRKRTLFTLIFGLISFISFLISLIIILCGINSYVESKILYPFEIGFLVFYIISFIFICINISKFNKLKSLYKGYDNFPRLINLIIFILYLALLVFLIFIGIYVGCLKDKCRECSCNIFTKKNKNENTIPNKTNPDNNKSQNNKSSQGRQASTLNITNNN